MSTSSRGNSGGGWFDALADALNGVDDSASFQALLATRPELFGEATVEELRKLVTIPGLGEAIKPFLRLLEDVKQNRERAWRQYERAMKTRANEEGCLAVIPNHVVHPDLLGGWRCRSPSNKEEPDEAPR